MVNTIGSPGSAGSDANRFTSLIVIGDSYGDQGNALRDNPVSSQVGANGRYGNALNIVDALQYHYAIATANLTNYAFGGATTRSVNNNPPALMLPGFSQQLDALVASGRRFSASDLITFTTAGVGGGNDTPLGISVAQGTANVVGYIQTLIALGARNIVLNAPTTAALQAALTPFASQGVNIYLFDQGALVTRILANPTAYGFAANATSLDYCSRLGGPNFVTRVASIKPGYRLHRKSWPRTSICISSPIRRRRWQHRSPPATPA